MEIVDNDYFLSFIRELLGTGSNWFRTELNHLEPQPVVLVVVLKSLEPNHWLWFWFLRFVPKPDKTGPRQH